MKGVRRPIPEGLPTLSINQDSKLTTQFRINICLGWSRFAFYSCKYIWQIQKYIFFDMKLNDYNFS